MVLINNIKDLRNELNMTQIELADIVGVRRETIGHLENNKYMPSLLLAYKISNVFGKRIDEVFSFEMDNGK